jgi:hypothetical protein
MFSLVFLRKGSHSSPRKDRLATVFTGSVDIETLAATMELDDGQYVDRIQLISGQDVQKRREVGVGQDFGAAVPAAERSTCLG